MSKTIVVAALAIGAGAGALGHHALAKPYPPASHSNFISKLKIHTNAWNFDMIPKCVAGKIVDNKGHGFSDWMYFARSPDGYDYPLCLVHIFDDVTNGFMNVDVSSWDYQADVIYFPPGWVTSGPASGVITLPAVTGWWTLQNGKMIIWPYPLGTF